MITSIIKPKIMPIKKTETDSFDAIEVHILKVGNDNSINSIESCLADNFILDTPKYIPYVDRLKKKIFANIGPKIRFKL